MQSRRAFRTQAFGTLNCMAENAIQTVQKTFQDILAPDIRELKMRVEALEKRMEERFAAAKALSEAQFKRVDTQFARVDTQFQNVDSQLDRVLEAVNDWKNRDISVAHEIGSLRERVAVLEQQQRMH